MTIAPGRTRVTFVLADLAGNPLARAAPLAAALAWDHDVAAVGLLAPGAEVYAPYGAELPVRPVRGSPRDPLAVLRLARAVPPGVVVACKPLPATLVAALAARRRGAGPVLLDVDDDEWSESAVEPGGGLRRRLARLSDLHALGVRVVHPLTRRVDAVTVSTRALQRRYGGTVIRHGPDERRFDPTRFGPSERAALRARFGLPLHGPLAVFAGVPRDHKGFGVLIEALARPESAAWTLAAAGGRGAAWHARAAARLGSRFRHLGAIPRSEVPALLAAADAAPIPQRPLPFAKAQLPAKLLDAMAMALPVVATAVGDLAEILGGGARGWLVPPDDAGALARALGEVGAEPDAARRRGAAARAWFLAEASASANRARLGAVVRGLVER